MAEEKHARSDPDYSAASVHELISGEQVALYHVRSTPNVFGVDLDMLARWYNFAFIVPEINAGHGLAVIGSLLYLEYPSERIYHKRGQVNDFHAERNIHELGFETTAKSRPQLLGNLDRMLKANEISISDEGTRAEFYSFVIRKDSTPGADVNCHDDRVFAVAMAAIGMGQAASVLESERMTREQNEESTSFYGGVAERSKKRGFDRWRPD